MNKKKTLIMRDNDRKIINGIVVNKGLNVPRKYYDSVKALLHNCKTNHNSIFFNFASALSFNASFNKIFASIKSAHSYFFRAIAVFLNFFNKIVSF